MIFSSVEKSSRGLIFFLLRKRWLNTPAKMSTFACNIYQVFHTLRPKSHKIAELTYELISCSFSAPLEHASVSQWTLDKDAASPRPPLRTLAALSCFAVTNPVDKHCFKMAERSQRCERSGREASLRPNLLLPLDYCHE